MQRHTKFWQRSIKLKLVHQPVRMDEIVVVVGEKSEQATIVVVCERTQRLIFDDGIAKGISPI